VFPCNGIFGLDVYFAIGDKKIKLTPFLLLALQMEHAMSFLKILQIETNGDLQLTNFDTLGVPWT
jgi:hypothetical protein